MNLLEFNPIRKKIIINSDEYILNYINIETIKYILEKYDNLDCFNKILEKATINILDEEFYECVIFVIWLLLESQIKENKYNNIIKFRKDFLKQEINIFKKNIEIFFKIIVNSFPPVNEEIEKEKGNEDNFSLIFVFFAKEFGYTLEQFYSLTLRQIYQIQKDLDFIKFNEDSFLAKIHNFEISNPKRNKTLNAYLSFSKKEDKELKNWAYRTVLERRGNV